MNAANTKNPHTKNLYPVKDLHAGIANGIRQGAWECVAKYIDELHANGIVYSVWRLLLESVVLDVSIANPTLIRKVYDEYDRALPTENAVEPVLKMAYALCMTKKTQIVSSIRWASRNITEFNIAPDHTITPTRTSAEWAESLTGKGVSMCGVVTAFITLLIATIKAYKSADPTAVEIEIELMGLAAIIYHDDVNEKRMVSGTKGIAYFKRPIWQMFNLMESKYCSNSAKPIISTLSSMCQKKLGYEEYNYYCAILICARGHILNYSCDVGNPPKVEFVRGSLKNGRTFEIKKIHLDHRSVRLISDNVSIGKRTKDKLKLTDPASYALIDAWKLEEWKKTHGGKVVIPQTISNPYIPHKGSKIPPKFMFETDVYATKICPSYDSDASNYPAWLKIFGRSTDDEDLSPTSKKQKLMSECFEIKETL